MKHKFIKECSFANFIYLKNDEQLVNDIAKYLDDNAKDIYSFFEIKNKHKVDILIIPTKTEYDLKFKKENKLDKNLTLPNNYVGCFCNNKIILTSFNDYINIESHKNNSIEDYKKTLLHEFTHFVNSLFNNENNCFWTDKYLKEGIACYLSKQKENKKIYLNCSLDDLLNNANNVKYDNFYLLTKFLIENYTKTFVLELFKSSRMAKEFLKNELFKNTNSVINKK